MYGGSPYVQVGTKRRVCGQFQPCTSAQTNPTPDVTLTLTLWEARGRHEVGRGGPAMHTTPTNFTRTSEKSWTYSYVDTNELSLLLSHNNSSLQCSPCSQKLLEPFENPEIPSSPSDFTGTISSTERVHQAENSIWESSPSGKLYWYRDQCYYSVLRDHDYCTTVLILAWCQTATKGAVYTYVRQAGSVVIHL